MAAFGKSVLSIRGPQAGIDFLLDNVTLYEVPQHTDWLNASRLMIDRHRKTDVNFRVSLPPDVSPRDVDIQIKLKKHLFAFGSKVEDYLMVKKRFSKFRHLFFSLFNWATIGSFKWRFDKGDSLYSPDFSKAMNALQVLRKNGVKVRAHSLLWGMEKNIPEAVLTTPPSQLRDLLKFRTEYMMNLTKGQVEHWDVQNELLHGRWYEETLQNPNVSQDIFKLARPLDPQVKLYLNEFTAVNSGANTEDLHDVAMRFIKAGTGIQGLGIQGHVKDLIKPDPTMIWRRLDRLAETGLELFMTEMDLGWDDELERADWFEDAMRAYFAHPGLSGVILWGFWKEQQRYKNKYLVHSDRLKFSEQGKRYVCLVKKEWTTDQTVNLDPGTAFTLRAFQGDYQVVVSKGGVPVQEETFTLGKEEQTVEIQVTTSNDAIEVASEPDLISDCLDQRSQRSDGLVTSLPSSTIYP